MIVETFENVIARLHCAKTCSFHNPKVAHTKFACENLDYLFLCDYTERALFLQEAMTKKEKGAVNCFTTPFSFPHSSYQSIVAFFVITVIIIMIFAPGFIFVVRNDNVD